MSSQFSRPSAAKIATVCKQRITALEADVSAKTLIPITGASVTATNVIAIYQAVIDHQDSIMATRAQLKTALAARDAAIATCQTTDNALEAWVLHQFGPTSQQSADFGFSARKAASVAPATRVLAAQKAAATRAARHTLGKSERLKIKAPPVAPPSPLAPASGSPGVTAAPGTMGTTPTPHP